MASRARWTHLPACTYTTVLVHNSLDTEHHEFMSHMVCSVQPRLTLVWLDSSSSEHSHRGFRHCLNVTEG
eukprot:4827611-Amphidinium_carterae.1